MDYLRGRQSVTNVALAVHMIWVCTQEKLGQVIGDTTMY